MKIKEYSIGEYGPLPERGRILLENFNLIFGNNESGKTLTIDALIKLLIGGSVAYFKNLDRVDRKPEGYIIILDENNKEIKIKGKNNIIDHLNLTSAEFCNLFVIRDSTLTLNQENDFYNNITDRLLGLRINDINKINDNLREIGKLTSTGRFTNRGDEKFDDRIKGAEDSIIKINKLMERIQNEHFDTLEKEIMNIEDNIQKINQIIENYNDAKKREIYEKGINELSKLQENKNMIKELDIFNENDKQNWKDFESKLEFYINERKDVISRTNDNEKKLLEIKRDLEEKNSDFISPMNIKRNLDSDIKPEIREYEMQRGELKRKAEKSKFFSLMLIISSILFGIFLLGGFLSSLIPISFLAMLFGFLSVFFFMYKFQYVRDKGWLEGIFERVNLKLSKFDLNGDSYEEISKNIQNFEEEYELKENELKNNQHLKEKFEDEIKKLKEESIPDMDMKINDIANKIENLKNKSKVESLKEYSAKLLNKQENMITYDNHIIILKNLFNIESQNEEESLLNWRNEIKKLEKFKDKSREIKYNEDSVLNLKDEIQKLESQINEINDKMVEIKNELLEVERKVNNIIQSKEDYFYCTTSQDLEVIKERLNFFLKESYEQKDKVLEIIGMFEEIEIEERKKISELLSEKSYVSEYFKEVTGGLYNKVIFEMDTGRIKVNRKDDNLIEVDKLSGGAYDQLYFSIRLALGEKLLADKKGFFILDDPFIKADSERLKKLIGMLKKISNYGWQIIYFTSKNEVATILKDDIENGYAKYFQLEEMTF